MKGIIVVKMRSGEQQHLLWMKNYSFLLFMTSGYLISSVLIFYSVLYVDNPDWTKCSFICVPGNQTDTIDCLPLDWFLIHTVSHNPSCCFTPKIASRATQPSVTTISDHCLTDLCRWMRSLCPNLYSPESAQVVNTVIFLPSRHQYAPPLCF